MNIRAIFFQSYSSRHEIWLAIESLPKQCERRDKTQKTKLCTDHVLEPNEFSNRTNCWTSQKYNLSFKRAKVYMEGENYVILSATCTTCRAYLIGYDSDKSKPDKKFKFSFKVINRNEKEHISGRKNVRNSGKNRRSLKVRVSCHWVHHIILFYIKPNIHSMLK